MTVGDRQRFPKTAFFNYGGFFDLVNANFKCNSFEN